MTIFLSHTIFTPLLPLAFSSSTETMNPIAAVICLILYIPCFFAVEKLYHDIFDVVYFGADGCLKEVFICGIIATIPVAIVYYLFRAIWKILIVAGIILIILFLIEKYGKNKKDKNDSE